MYAHGRMRVLAALERASQASGAARQKFLLQ